MIFLSNPAASRLRILAVKDDLKFNIHELIDDAKCFRAVREMRWPDGVTRRFCNSSDVIKYGHDDKQPERQRYQCHGCSKRFDDLKGTIFAGRHQPLRTWITCLYLMGLNLSTLRIASELRLSRSNVQNIVKQLRQGIVDSKPPVPFEGEVECDEVYILAGHKGHPDAVKKTRTAKPAGRSGPLCLEFER